MSQAKKIEPWMLITVLVALALAIFNFDPIGDWLVQTFGKGADMQAVNLVLVVLILDAIFFHKKK